MGRLTVQQILPQGYAAFARDHPQPAYVRRAAWALLVCRTAVLGGMGNGITHVLVKDALSRGPVGR